MARARSTSLSLLLSLSLSPAGLLCGLCQSNSSEIAACIEEAKQNIPETPRKRATKLGDPPHHPQSPQRPRPRPHPRVRLLSSCLRKCAVPAVYLRNLIKRITKTGGEPEPGLNRRPGKQDSARSLSIASWPYGFLWAIAAAKANVESQLECLILQLPTLSSIPQAAGSISDNRSALIACKRATYW